MYKCNINEVLPAFNSIGLNDMDRVRLMNRVETKYVFSANILPDLLGSLSFSYMMLEIERLREFPYCTTYLDTPDFKFLNQQVTGKLNRYKIRFRKYESSGQSFLEIKKKTNKDRTIKWRIENNSDTNFPDENAASFIRDHFPFRQPSLKPVLITTFTRITLVGKEFNERLTFDYNLEFTSSEGRNEVLPFLAIAELKKGGYSMQSPFINTMRQFGIRQNGFSKYCIGNALVRDIPRKNTLKRNLLLINKIENENN